MAERGKRQKIMVIWGKNVVVGDDHARIRYRPGYDKNEIYVAGKVYNAFNTPFIPKARHKNSWTIKKNEVDVLGDLLG